MFCSRFLKVSEYVSAEAIRQEFGREVSNLMEILDDLLLLRKRRNSNANGNSNSQSRLTVGEPGADGNFFEGLLDRVLRDKETNSTTHEEIATEMVAVRQEMQSSKAYYE